MSSKQGVLGVVMPMLLACLLLCTFASTMSAVHFAAAYTPQRGDSFSYSETITVNNGQGSYVGYNDKSTVSGGEQVLGVAGSIIAAAYNYTYNYSNNQGNSTSGSSSGPYTWSLGNYTYLNGTDNQAGYSKPVYVWFAMNASLPVGATFYALNTQLTVLSKNYSFQLPTEGNNYVQTIQAQGTGQYQRNDSYGVFTASYSWDEYFDPSTGYIVGYNYLEQDNGQYKGQVGSFTYTDDVYVTSTSYPLAPASAPSTITTTIGSIPSNITITNTPTVPGGANYLGPYFDELALLGVIVVILVIAVAYAVSHGRRRRETLPEHTAMPPPPPPQSPALWQSGIDLGSKPPEQVVIKEIPKVACKYCGTLIPITAETCPYCGAPQR